MEEKSSKCLFCQKPSKYTCPRCFVQYCSTICYKSEQHLECSENFYKEEVVRELKSMKGTPAEKQKIIQMLMTEKKENEDFLNSDVSQRLEDVCLNDTDRLWDRLTEDEKHIFLKKIHSGNVNFLSDWQPWWEVERLKVVDISDKFIQVECPKILKNIPDLKHILSKSPSSNVQYNIMEVILVYIYSMRLHNGDLYDYPEDSLNIIFSLSKSLSQNYMFDSLSCVIYTLTENINRNKLVNASLITLYLKDAELILVSKDHYVLVLLSDLYRFLKWCKKYFPSKLGMAPAIYKTMKKLYFYIAFAKQFSYNISEISLELYSIRNKMVEESKLINQQRNDIEANLEQLKLKQQQKVLIEEIH
ncbi:zinc finger HIT domain-containing protein 2 isoform X1 [Hydra vulgaris]|uniref:zinc finger HIT domain-containing protein 2 isoform X1 n=1 Tax=Hydra vulgaris TaxID=6087 RepID=UPI001F5E52DA|nr:zinc finger HIT domain-containing protein 2 [Hydra vulgaris]